MVMVGCCYHPFTEQKFGKILFLAIIQSEQVLGYATRLMAQTEEKRRKCG